MSLPMHVTLLTSALGTNIVENFFSQIRRKQRYFSLWEYSCIYNRAIHEIMKHNCYNLPFSYPVGKRATYKLGLSGRWKIYTWWFRSYPLLLSSGRMCFHIYPNQTIELSFNVCPWSKPNWSKKAHCQRESKSNRIHTEINEWSDPIWY